MERVILHSDLNSFYASVECLYNPDIREKPVAVCGSQSTRHGIVLAKNMHAKGFGIKTGEAIWQAKSKCPELVVVRPNYGRYLRFSAMARKIYEQYTDLVESFGIDESWLDITESTKLYGNGLDIANEIRNKVKEELGITVSIGLSFNKIFAKLGSDMKKPDAVTPITSEDFQKKVWPLPVNDLLYVGRSTYSKLSKVGIVTIGDLANSPVNYLKNLMGKWGETLWLFANGYEDTPVQRVEYESLIKGIGNSLTTPRDMGCFQDIKMLCYVLSESVATRLRRHGLKGRTVQISIRDKKLESLERQAKFSDYTDVSGEICEKALEVFQRSWDWHESIRSFGVRVTDLVEADTFMQLSLFDDERHIKRQLLDRSIDGIRSRFGHYSIQRAILIKEKSLNANPVEENIIHPVSFFR